MYNEPSDKSELTGAFSMNIEIYPLEKVVVDGIPTENNEDVAEEMRKANHWATIGVGVVGYYQH